MSLRSYLKRRNDRGLFVGLTGIFVILVILLIQIIPLVYKVVTGTYEEDPSIDNAVYLKADMNLNGNNHKIEYKLDMANKSGQWQPIYKQYLEIYLDGRKILHTLDRNIMEAYDFAIPKIEKIKSVEGTEYILINSSETEFNLNIYVVSETGENIASIDVMPTKSILIKNTNKVISSQETSDDSITLLDIDDDDNAELYQYTIKNNTVESKLLQEYSKNEYIILTD